MIDQIELQSAEFDAWWVGAGLLPQNFVYFMYDHVGHLLYVGITNNLRNRLSAHYADKPWIKQVKRIVVERYDTREESKARETFVIKNQGPIFNIAEAQHLTNWVNYHTYHMAEACPEAVSVGERLAEVADRQFRMANPLG